MTASLEHAALITISENVLLAQNFLGELDAGELSVDPLRLYGLTHALLIISEASRRLTQPLKDRHPSQDWHGMAAAGNVYRHRYEHVGEQDLIDVVRGDLPDLLKIVEAELAAYPSS